MAYVNTNPVGKSRDGYPVYLYRDPYKNALRYVVVLADGRAFYSDSEGNIASPFSHSDDRFAGAVVAGALGALLGGPLWGVIGAIGGAIAGNWIPKLPGPAR